MRGDRIDHPAQGLFGGGPGAPGRVTLNGEPMHSKRTIQVHPGDSMVLQTPGGGGYGDAASRSETARANDLRNGYVTENG